MSNTKDTLAYFLQRIGNTHRITTRIEHGECTVYADGREVAYITDDLLYIPVCPASASLENECEKDVPFLGAKQHYVIGEDQIADIPNIAKILFAIAAAQ